MTTFFFVRHGVTAHTAHKLSGWLPDIPLSDEGRMQVEAAADTLADVPLAAVYSSPIDRTMETARAIAARHHLEVHPVDGIAEVRYGRWTNRSYKALRRTKLWTTVQRFPSAARFPDGEALRDVQARAVNEVEGLRAKHRRGNVCCVSHADVIRLIAAHYLGVHIDLFQRLLIDPASITAIALTDEGPLVIAVNVPSRRRPSR
jgi:probable phosphomutase (TIGR03848 family)